MRTTAAPRLRRLLVGASAALAVAVMGLPMPAHAASLSIGDPVLSLAFEGDVDDDALAPNPVTLRSPAGSPSASYVDGVTEGSKALQLGPSTYLDLGVSADLQPAALTTSFWLKPSSPMTGEQVITWNKRAYNSDGWYLTSEGDASPLAISVGPGGAQPYKLRVTSTDRAAFFPVGQWTHVVVTYDSDTKRAVFYRNGVRVPSAVAEPVAGASTGVITGDTALPKTVGFNGPQYNGAYLRTAIDQLELWSGVAPLSDVVTLYERGGGVIDSQALAQEAADAISLPDTASVGIVLPAEGTNGSLITWTSSDPAVIDPDGTVTQPGADEEDASVTLTASVRYGGGEPVTRSFVVTVSAVREVLQDTGLGVLMSDDYLNNAAAKEHDYLLSLSSKKFLYWNYRTAGLTPPTADGYGGWENGNVGGNFRGHAFGHYMSALAMSYASTRDPAVKAGLHQQIVDAVAGLAEVQASYDGTSRAGYLGPFRDTALDAVEGRGASDDPVIVPYYNLHKILAGLLEINAYVDDATGAQALAIAERFGEYLYGRVSTLADTSVMLRTEYGGMNDSLYTLFQRSGGNPHFKQAAEAFDEVALFRSLAAGDDVLPGKHANTTIPKLIGALKRYTVFTQDPALYETLTAQEKADLPTYLNAATNFFRIVVDDHTYATGANSQSEHFHDPDSLYAMATQSGGTGNPQTAETCNEYNMLKLSRELFKITQDVRYLDYYENTFINTIVSSQNPDSGMTTYFQAMAPGYNKLYAMPFTDFWCCVGTGMENFSKLGDSIYYVGDDGLWVSMFFGSTVEHTATNLRLTQEADLPNDDTVRFRVAAIDGGAVAEGATVRLRVPDWIAGAPSLVVNGEPVTPTVKRGFVVLDSLSAGDVIDYTMPMEVRAIATEDNPDFIALQYGPALLSAGLGTANLGATSPVGIGVRVAVNDPAAQSTILVDAASVAEWKSAVASNVVRMADTADGQVQFRLLDTADGGDLRFTPHYRRHDERYGLYFSYEVQDSAAQQQRIMTAKQALRDSEIAVDQLMTFDSNNSEAAKNLRTNGFTESGTYNGQTFRHANNAGSWFSYDLAVDPTVPNYLKVRYYGGDNGRTFDVYTDGVKLKTERITNAGGATSFYWQTDAIPADQVADGMVTVKFQSTGGWVGGVFGLRTSRPEVYSTDARLSSLSASSGVLSPAFSADVSDYALAVPVGTESVSLDLAPHVASGLVRVDGVLIDDTRPRVVRLTPGTARTVAIQSVAQDHTTVADYTLRIEEAVVAPPVAPVATSSPRVTGPAMVGRRLTSSTGTWDVPGVTLTRQWLVDGRPVVGATAASYVVRAVDVGRRMSVRVTAVASDRPSGVAESVSSARVAKASSTIKVVAPKVVRAGKKATVAVTVSAVGVRPTGVVKLYDRGRLVRTVSLATGRIVVRLRLAGVGRHTIKAVYAGSTSVAASSRSVVLRVRR